MHYFNMTKENKQKLSAAIDKCKKLAEELKLQKNIYLEDRMLATRYALTAASLENIQDHLTVPLDQLDYELLLQDIESYDDRELSNLLEMFSPEKPPLERPPTPENDRLRRAILINNNNKAHPNVPLTKPDRQKPAGLKP